jgi:hypothetical protein
MPPKQRKLKTIEPDKVNTVDEWLSHYQRKYTNVVLDEGGYLSVYDVTDTKKLVKRIPQMKSVDIHNILGSSASSDELREQAIQANTAIVTERNHKVDEATATFIDDETKLLDIMIQRDSKNTMEQRIEHAKETAQQILALEKADETLQNAKYTFRSILKKEHLLRNELDYTTRDPRPYNFTVFSLMSQQTSSKDRAIPIPVALTDE